MIPILTPEEMAEVDRSAPEPVEVLVERAGFAVARAARRLMGGAYGRTVVVVAGRGNNGSDGRVAARWLSRWGARVRVLDALEAGAARLPTADLVIDAAYGTGLSRPYDPPDPRGTPVLAVDIPSGLSGLTGAGRSMAAAATVTFGAYKPGLLLGDGPDKAGAVELAGIGLEGLAAQVADAWLVGDADLSMLPGRLSRAHKWQSAVLVVGGSEAMTGAPLLVAGAAMRSGAGYALVAVPGSPPGGGLPPGEHVGASLPAEGWHDEASLLARRVKALAVGPGLGDRARGPGGSTGADTPVGQLLAATDLPAVVDADALNALGGLDALRSVAAGRNAPIVVTPHEGEYRRLTGRAPGEDRIADVRAAASETGAVFLLKGSTTVVASPEGRVLVSASGSPRLATAGTGDVLTGVIAAFLARGLPALEAAALAAHAHGEAAQRGPREGLVAGDLPVLLSRYLSEVGA
ncbi:MAG TPA: NAD(P)H-hydrate dehydratase [Acidimicrobiales bacterium]|nr:NAD(P)H-hydrate dehydratase [Acidimicrobiales bacterium]